MYCLNWNEFSSSHRDLLRTALWWFLSAQNDPQWWSPSKAEGWIKWLSSTVQVRASGWILTASIALWSFDEVRGQMLVSCSQNWIPPESHAFSFRYAVNACRGATICKEQNFRDVSDTKRAKRWHDIVILARPAFCSKYKKLVVFVWECR